MAGREARLGSLAPEEFRSILAILELVERAGSVSEFRSLALDALDEHFGYTRGSFLLAGPPESGFMLTDRVVHGMCEAELKDFLVRKAGSQLSLWLDTGTPTHGYISIFGLRRLEFGERDRSRLAALRPHFANLLGSLLTSGRRLADLDGLTPREGAVARLVGGGWSNDEIAHQLGVTEHTVKKHLTRVMSKLGMRNRTQVALLLRHEGSA